MNRKLQMALGMVAGAFLIHCGQGAVHDMLGDAGPSPNDGFVGDVRAWRFKPFMENGVAVPVCTGAIMQYRVTN